MGGNNVSIIVAESGEFFNFDFSSFVKAAKISFSSFRSGFDSGMNFLRRRFSSGDLQGDLRNDDELNFQKLNFRKGPSPSAPSSPSKTQQTAGLTSGLFSSSQQQQQQKPAYNKDRCKILLIIDDVHTDW